MKSGHVTRPAVLFLTFSLELPVEPKAKALFRATRARDEVHVYTERERDDVALLS